MKKILLLIAFISFLYGCITMPKTNIVAIPKTPNNKVKIIVPKKYIKDNQLILSFNKTFFRYKSDFRGIEYNQTGNQIIVWKSYGFYASTGRLTKSKKTYWIKKEIKEQSKNYIITLIPEKEEEYIDYDLFNRPYKPVEFEINDVLQWLTRGEIKVYYEFNAPYPAESIYANFKRLLKYEQGSYKDEITGKIYKSRFYLDNNKLYINVYPYRKGSKVLVYLSLQYTDEIDGKKDNIVDLREVIKTIGNKIKKIIFD